MTAIPAMWQDAGRHMDPASDPPPVSMTYEKKGSTITATFLAGSARIDMPRGVRPCVVVSFHVDCVELDDSDPNNAPLHDIRMATARLAARVALPDDYAYRLGPGLGRFLTTVTEAIRGHSAWKGYLENLEASMQEAYLVHINDFRGMRDSRHRIHMVKNFRDATRACMDAGVPEDELVRAVREELAGSVLKS